MGNGPGEGTVSMQENETRDSRLQHKDSGTVTAHVGIYVKS